jgi:hypothetical protein
VEAIAEGLGERLDWSGCDVVFSPVDDEFHIGMMLRAEC